MTVGEFITQWAATRFLKRLTKELKNVWNDELLISWFDVCEATGIPSLLELEKEMYIILEDQNETT